MMQMMQFTSAAVAILAFLLIETRALTMDFSPQEQNIQLKNGELIGTAQPIICRVDRAAKIMIEKKADASVEETERCQLPKGVSVILGDGEAMVQFDRYEGDCYTGTYVCTAEDDSGNKVSKEARVYLDGHPAFSDSRIRFGPDGAGNSAVANVESDQNVVLRCSLKDKAFGRSPLRWPFITFHYVENSGDERMLNETPGQPKFEWGQARRLVMHGHQNKEVIGGFREITIVNVSPSDTGLYLCRVFFFDRRCSISKKLQLYVY